MESSMVDKIYKEKLFSVTRTVSEYDAICSWLLVAPGGMGVINLNVSFFGKELKRLEVFVERHTKLFFNVNVFKAAVSVFGKGVFMFRVFLEALDDSITQGIFHAPIISQEEE